MKNDLLSTRVLWIFYEGKPRTTRMREINTIVNSFGAAVFLSDCTYWAYDWGRNKFRREEAHNESADIIYFLDVKEKFIIDATPPNEDVDQTYFF